MVFLCSVNIHKFYWLYSLVGLYIHVHFFAKTKFTWKNSSIISKSTIYLKKRNLGHILLLTKLIRLFHLIFLFLVLNTHVTYKRMNKLNCLRVENRNRRPKARGSTFFFKNLHLLYTLREIYFYIKTCDNEICKMLYKYTEKLGKNADILSTELVTALRKWSAQ